MNKVEARQRKEKMCVVERRIGQLYHCEEQTKIPQVLGEHGTHTPHEFAKSTQNGNNLRTLGLGTAITWPSAYFFLCLSSPWS